jgi:prolyl oligopeptidase
VSIARIGDDGSRLYFKTNLLAQNYQVAIYDVESPNPGFTTLVAENPEAMLTSASIHSRDNLVLVYLRDAKHEIHIHDLLTGKPLRQIFEDLIGTLSVIGRREDSSMFIYYSGFVSPGSVYR